MSALLSRMAIVLAAVLEHGGPTWEEFEACAAGRCHAGDWKARVATWLPICLTLLGIVAMILGKKP